MFKLIMAILPKGKIKAIMPAIKDIGIFGATMLSGKGLCTKEGERVIGCKIGPSREILMIITLDVNKDKIVKALAKQGNLKTPGKGIIFVMDINEVIG
jgi:nitrogen regulatory protein P-II 1